jgi:hypothetical protein
VFDHDMQFSDEFRHFNQPTTMQMLDLGPTRTGVTYNVWSVGPAIMWAPFYAIGHLAAMATGAAQDGYSPPYLLAIGLGTATWALLGMLMAYKLCRERFGLPASLLAVMALWFASSLTAYTFFHPSLSHGLAFFAVTGFYFTWWRSRGRRLPQHWILIGVFCGLMAMVRLQDLVLVVPVLVVELLKGRHRLAGVAAGIAAVTFIPQMVAWWALYHRVITNPYSEFSSNATFIYWQSPHVLDVLVGANHGMLTWTPVLVPALAGLAWLSWRRDPLALVLAAGFLIQLYLVAAWFEYWQGASFGGRMFIDISLGFVLGLAGLLEQVRGRAFLAAAAGVGALGVWNSLFMLQYGSGALPLEGPVSWPTVFSNQIAYAPALLDRGRPLLGVLALCVVCASVLVLLAKWRRRARFAPTRR